MSIFRKYSHYPPLDNTLESIENEGSSNVQYNYVPEHGFFFPNSGMNYVIGIDGHRTVVEQKRVNKPLAFIGTLFCPCFATEEPFSEESRLQYRNCFLSFTFLMSIAEIIVLGVMLKDGIAPVRENTSIGPAHSVLVKFGAKELALILHHKEPWRLASSTFLHAGIFHAIFNLAIQFRLGMYLEREWGWISLLLTYLVCGVGGTVLSCILQPGTIGVGASGPIAGLVAAYGFQVAMDFRNLDAFQRKLQVFQFLAFLGMVLLMILCPFVDWSDIAGGAACGLLIGFAIWDFNQHRILWAFSIILLLLGLSVGVCYILMFM